MERQEGGRHSILRLTLELIEQSIVLVFVELKNAALELKHNINSAKSGAVFAALGGFLLLFSLLAATATVIIALAIALPLWLSALIVTAALLFLGAALLFAGLGKLKHFSLVPKGTVDRIEGVGKKLKQHAEAREARDAKALVAREAAHREAEAAPAEAVRREHLKEAVHKEAARVRELTYAKEKRLEREGKRVAHGRH